MRLTDWYDAFKHGMGALLMVRSWPSRRYMAKLREQEARVEAEVIDLRARAGLQPDDLRPLVDAVGATVVALEETVLAKRRGLRVVR